MLFFQRSLRTRIFLSMTLTILGASIVIALVNISQFKKEASAYHNERFLSKQNSIQQHMGYILKTTTYPIETSKLPLIFKDKIYEIKIIHKQGVYIYDLEGKPLISSNVTFLKNDNQDHYISEDILEALANSSESHYIYKFTERHKRFQSYYSYLTDASFKPLGIVRLPYIEDESFLKKEFRAYLIKMGITYLLLVGLSIILSYFLSEYITRSIKQISDKIQQTRFDKTNEKLYPKAVSQEISILINAYNDMIDELERSAAKMAMVERETAWREMAKQVAHEIKNPLTPMRLSVQNFSRRYDPSHPNSEVQVQEFAQGLIQQIDTMAAIASAFSTYADLPESSNFSINIVKATKLAVEVFDQDFITFKSNKKEIKVNIDKTQLTRVLTNLIKNSLQAIEYNQIIDPFIFVELESTAEFIRLTVKDNGGGIDEKNIDKIFEPKFTTKTSGMGLGLGMVKNIVKAYGGTIEIYNNNENGATFTLSFPNPE